ncbi:MAG: hypothetical protein ACXVYY_01215 [Oryzihumus sp.]
MDPDAALDHFRRLMLRAAANDADGLYRAADECRTVAAQVMEGLDQWLSDGGFLPKAWYGARWRQ